jgi:ABC-type thiamin/hydroxymethylpyrimidine transport system permease subunit
MRIVDWKLRAKVFLERLWQPTFACMTCMTAPSFANLMSTLHWKIALQTGFATGILALLLTLTPVGRLFAHRYGNALMVGGLTAAADAWSHPGRFGFGYGEALLTGLVSGLLALAGSFLFEDRARRVRRAWARIREGAGAR